MTRSRVRRSVIRRTIYVENIKADATENWLKAIFSKFGDVVKVTLPTYRRDRNLLKGYAFVEYKKKQDLKKVVKFFKKLHCVIPSWTNPANLCGIETFEHSSGNGEKKDKAFKGCSKRPAPTSDADNKSSAKKRKIDIDNEMKKATGPRGKLRKNYLRRLQMRILPKTLYVKLKNKFMEEYKKKVTEDKINDILTRPLETIFDEFGTNSQSKNNFKPELQESCSETKVKNEPDSEKVPELKAMREFDCRKKVSNNKREPKFESEKNHYVSDFEKVPVMIYVDDHEFDSDDEFFYIDCKGESDVDSDDSSSENKREFYSPSRV